MGTVLEFRPLSATKSRQPNDMSDIGEIVIFPGVRIERYDLDLGYRVRNSAGSEDFHGLGPQQRPRKTS